MSSSWKRKPRSYLRTLTFLGALWLVTGAHAQARRPQNPEEARPALTDPLQSGEAGGGSPEFWSLISRGLAAYRSNDFAQARKLIERAHALEPSARTLRVLGIIDFAQDSFDAARKELQAALQDRRRPLGVEQQKEVQQLLAWMAASLATLHVQVTPADAELRLDGVPLASDRTLVTEGEHRLRCSAPNFIAQEQTLKLSAAQELSLRIQLLPAVSPPLAANLAPAPPPSAASPRTWPMISTASAVVSLAGAGALLGFYLHDRIRVTDAPVGVRLQDIEPAHDRAPWLLAGAITLGVVGAAALTYAGVTLFASGSTAHSRVAIALEPGAVTLRARYE